MQTIVEKKKNYTLVMFYIICGKEYYLKVGYENVSMYIVISHAISKKRQSKAVNKEDKTEYKN